MKYLFTLYFRECTGKKWAKPEPILSTNSFGIIHLLTEIFEAQGCICEVDVVLDFTNNNHQIRTEKNGISSITISNEEVFRCFGINNATNSAIMHYLSEWTIITSENRKLKENISKLKNNKNI